MPNTIQQDNTRVYTPIRLQPIKMSAQQQREQKLKELSKSGSTDRISDANLVSLYRNMQDFYNQNAFGYGIQGNKTNYDATTEEGRSAIQSNFDYAKGNAMDFLGNVAGIGVGEGITRGATSAYNKFIGGVFRTPTKRGYLGYPGQYTRNNTIGEGAEAIVVKNTPTTVGKITTIPVEEMEVRNSIPNVVPSKYIGFVRGYYGEMPTYIQRKMRLISKEQFPKYAPRLDNSMYKYGFRRVKDPTVQYRAYTNGNLVIDDISPDNIGLDWLGRPKIIDFSVQTVPEWLEQGLMLKNGGTIERIKHQIKYASK